MKPLLTLLLALTLASTGRANNFRWHISYDKAVLLDDDARGQRLVLPADYQDALEVAQVHYGEINPDSFEGKTNSYGQPSYTLNYDIAPRHILSSDELNSWANAECAKTGKAWWWFGVAECPQERWGAMWK